MHMGQQVRADRLQQYVSTGSLKRVLTIQVVTQQRKVQIKSTRQGWGTKESMNAMQMV